MFGKFELPLLKKYTISDWLDDSIYINQKLVKARRFQKILENEWLANLIYQI